MEPSALEARFRLQCQALLQAQPVEQYMAIPGRRYRFDFAWPAARLLVEVQGGIWQRRSGHNTGRGLIRDYRKNNLAVMHGWRVIYIPTELLDDLTGIELVRQLLGEVSEGT